MVVVVVGVGFGSNWALCLHFVMIIIIIIMRSCILFTADRFTCFDLETLTLYYYVTSLICRPFKSLFHRSLASKGVLLERTAAQKGDESKLIEICVTFGLCVRAIR
jgi:hypothetical protein